MTVLRSILLLVVTFMMSACNTSNTLSPPNSSARLRVLAALNDGTLEMDVTLEGSNGEALNGAYVSARTPEGALVPATWSTARNGYHFTLPGVGGTYHVRVDSAAAGVLETDVPVAALQALPEVLDVADADGNSVRNYDRVRASSPLLVTWKSVPGAERYLLNVKQNGQTVVNLTTSETSAVLPASTLAGVSGLGQPASVKVTASVQAGDPLYVQHHYLSTSTTSSVNLGFQVVP
ncbi:hypothetical protein [Deinococcus aestuarii]|uniref:hypothetical protein n=1 Tax=Deinococcus aestuarii TaxID=2774531 RepID=UPI001C0E3C2A|nr:hypothetical protein [Deinococcus aestuarii]